MASASLPQLTQRVGITLIASSGGTCWHLGCGAPFPSLLLLRSLPREPGRGLLLGQEDSLPQVLWEPRGACGETGDSLTSLRTAARPPPPNVRAPYQPRVSVGCSYGPLTVGLDIWARSPATRPPLARMAFLSPQTREGRDVAWLAESALRVVEDDRCPGNGDGISEDSGQPQSTCQVLS